MNPNESLAAAPAPLAEDTLLQLELSIAQRADRLAQKYGAGHGRDLVYWLEAEREVFALRYTHKALADS